MGVGREVSMLMIEVADECPSDVECEFVRQRSSAYEGL